MIPFSFLILLLLAHHLLHVLILCPLLGSTFWYNLILKKLYRPLTDVEKITHTNLNQDPPYNVAMRHGYRVVKVIVVWRLLRYANDRNVPLIVYFFCAKHVHLKYIHIKSRHVPHLLHCMFLNYDGKLVCVCVCWCITNVLFFSTVLLYLKEHV